MGQDKKINIGRLINSMQWLEPVFNRSPTGFVNKSWKPSGMFFSDIVSDEMIKEETEHEQVKQQKIMFVAWRYDITTDWKIKYNGMEYEMKNIRVLEHGLYAEYTMTCKIKDNGSKSN